MKNQLMLTGILISLVPLAGCNLVIEDKPTSMESNEETTQTVTLDSEEEAQQSEFEDKQQVSEDDSLDVLEAELNQTVILDEDFTDL